MFRNRKYRAKKKFNTAESDLVLAKSYVVARPTAQSKEYLRLTEAAVVETKTALDKTIEDLAAQEKTKPAGVETPLLQWNREHKNLYGKNWKAKVKLNTAESNLVYFQSNPSQSSGDVRTPEQIVVETKTALDKTIADLAAHQKAKPGAPPNYDDDKDDKDSFVEDEEEEEEDEEEPELANDYSDDDLEIVLAKKQQPIIISVDDSKDDEEGTFLQKGQNTASALARFRFGDKESDIAAPVSLKEEE